MRTLTIISHTEHYKDSNGNIVGLGSTITEINNLAKIFDRIIHVAMLHSNIPPSSSLPYLSDKITFIALPAVGGPKLKDKFKILFNSIVIIRTIISSVKETDYFQFRAPTGIGVFVIPYLILFSSKKGWFKYAGNWKQENAPTAYSFQRWLLKKQKRKVTINGNWKDQPQHCLTFENPCISDMELMKGKEIVASKTIDNKKFEFCFVGRLEDAKGLGLLIEAFKNMSKQDKERIEAVHIVGDGKNKQDYINSAIDSEIKFEFYGFLSRKQVQEIYIKSHAIILPSASEGFPKVIAEAMNFGCLPIVSNVSSIDNYVRNGENGFLLEQISAQSLVTSIQQVLNLSVQEYYEMVRLTAENLSKFTYNYYNNRIMNEIINT